MKRAEPQFLSTLLLLQSRVEWQEVLGLRLLLRQPSPVWRAFTIEEVTAYRELPRLPPFNVPILHPKQQVMSWVNRSSRKKRIVVLCNIWYSVLQNRFFQNSLVKTIIQCSWIKATNFCFSIKFFESCQFS